MTSSTVEEIEARARVCRNPNHPAFTSCAVLLGKFDVPQLLREIDRLREELTQKTNECIAAQRTAEQEAIVAEIYYEASEALPADMKHVFEKELARVTMKEKIDGKG